MADQVIDVKAEVVKPTVPLRIRTRGPRPSRARPPKPPVVRRRRATQLEADVAMQLTQIYLDRIPTGDLIPVTMANAKGVPKKTKLKSNHKKAILYVYGYMLKMVQGIV